jgi:hypothetical protein
MTFKPGIEIVIMARDRPEYLRKAMDAIEKIDFGVPTHLVISNNSATCAPLIDVDETKWEIRNREQNLDPHTHYTCIVAESKFEWSCITHDDDELLPHFGKLFRCYHANPEVRFISGLATIKNLRIDVSANFGYQNRIARSGITQELQYRCVDFLQAQFNVGSLLPFSAIAVRTEYMCAPNNKFGFAGDYYFAMAICSQKVSQSSKSLIYDSLNPIINYRLHEEQDSQNPRMRYEMPILSAMCRFQILEDNRELVEDISVLKLILQSLYAIRLAKIGGDTSRKCIVDFERLLSASTLFQRRSALKFLLFKIGPNVVGMTSLANLVDKIKWKIRSFA